MERAPVNGIELEYELRGTGEPIILIHAGVCAAFFAPLVQERALTRNFTLVRYHRTGYAGSGRLPGAVSFARQAAHCRALMRHLGVERAHIVGHSSSVSMALQLALDAPDAVHSLVLMDPARPTTLSGAHVEMVETVVEPALQRFRVGDERGAIDVWMRGTCGADYRAVLERALPGALDQAVADADTFFRQELPAVMQWTFGPEQAVRIHQPALAVLGEHSIAVFRERHELLLAWLPDVEPFELPEATHLLHVQNPGGMANALASFVSRHPLQGTAAPPVPVDRP